VSAPSLLLTRKVMLEVNRSILQPHEISRVFRGYNRASTKPF
jgi:hypothetical protein